MYNGIGLETARGSGTNGFVQRNLSSIKVTKDKIQFRTEGDLNRLEAELQHGPNKAILEHAKKRQLELKCAEMEEVMKDEGYSEKEICEKVKMYREMLRDRQSKSDKKSDVDFKKSGVRETHALAEAQEAKNARLKAAFGLSDFFVDGSSFDPDRKQKEDAARQLRRLEEQQKKEEERLKRKAEQESLSAKRSQHQWVNTPSPSPPPVERGRKEERSRERSKNEKNRKEKDSERKEKNKKRERRDRSSSTESTPPRKSKKNKKNKRSK